MTRARNLLLLLAAFVAGGTAAALAQNPDLHNQGAETGAIVESPEAMTVTTAIQCFCGTCVNQSLHECTCGLASMERRKVAAALAAGATPDQLIAQYVKEHGPQVRLVPERSGFNMIGWAMPFAASITGLLVLSIVLLGWQRKGALRARATETTVAGSTPPGEAAYRARLERELSEFD